jgi:hypothetical protein
VADGCYGLQIVDLSNSANPQRIGGYDTSGNAYDVALSGDYAYVADGDHGLQVIDLSNPARPRRVGGCATSMPARHVAVSGNDGCILEQGWDYSAGVLRARLTVIDISDPANPRHAGGYDIGHDAYDVAVSGHLAYVRESSHDGTNWITTLRAIDISNPAQPQQVDNYDANGWGYGLPVSTSFTYAPDPDEVWLVNDVSDPANPKRVGGYKTIASAFGAAVSGYYACAGRGLIDISNPANPQLVVSFDLLGLWQVYVQSTLLNVLPGLWQAGVALTPYSSSPVPGDVAFSGRHVYGMAGGRFGGRSARFVVIDISPAANPQRLGSLDTSGQARGVAVSGNFAYVQGDGLQVIEVSNPANPQLISAYDTSGWGYGLPVSTNFTYAPDPEEVWLVSDISDPANPTRVGGYKTIAAALGGVVSGHYAYVLGGWEEGGLRMIDVSNPTTPRELGADLLVSGQMVVSGNFAYLAGRWLAGADNWVSGLQVIDISDPAHPQSVGAYETSYQLTDVAVSGDYAYATTDPSGVLFYGSGAIEVIDISNPTNPHRVGKCDLGSTAALSVAVSGHYAYVMQGWHRLDGTEPSCLAVIDVSDPANPRRVGGNSAFTGWNVAVSGDRVYVAAGEDGLAILNTYQPPPRIESTEFGEDGFRLVFRGEAGRTIRLQRSPDLKTWEDWVLLTATGDAQAVADPSVGSQPCQFYRLVGQ